ncbi:MAG TPA: NAD(P)(+) transhydrogenase (Re/Si-specific) subunit beta [Chloroflexota bacterium]|nr:NAD(P)(+) transhydrogenase (Re/Si-specific) subunit beta [Chloroflexota bacterium]
MSASAAIGVAYLVASLTFIIGLRMLSSPVTANRGNRVAAAGMTIALIATLLTPGLANYGLIAAGIIVGGAIGAGSARKVRMTAMPQMVAIFNGMGGGAAALVSSLEFVHRTSGGGTLQTGQAFTIALGAAIGSVSFAGSLIAFAKLQEIMKGNALQFQWTKIASGLLVVAVLALVVVITLGTDTIPVLIALLAVAVILGLVLVIPIGGADMPVVISLMNSLTGLAAALTGFVLNNELLIVAGALVGASGTLLTRLMARAMNRPLSNVLFGSFGATVTGGGELPAGATVREISVDDAAVLMSYSQRVVIVPGYGLAVAQAQHQVRELADILSSRGVQVKYAIHPVAGRMPGHMNVLLAEADVPYSEVYEMDAINGEFPSTDVVLVVGANDITNPAARSDPSSPIYGMPILNVDEAQHIIVLKRSMRPGFAGIDNPLYYNPRTAMLFGDAKDSLQKLVAAAKTVAMPRERRTRSGEPEVVQR